MPKSLSPVLASTVAQPSDQDWNRVGHGRFTAVVVLLVWTKLLFMPIA